jgi:hypothetical protein
VIPGIRVPLSRDPGLWDQAVDLGLQVIMLHTFSTKYPETALHRLAEPQPTERDGPRIVGAIPYTTEEMPETVQYDEQTQTLFIGTTGQVAPVPAVVWHYRVGGMRIVDKWIRYRLKKPRGRPPSSPLDTENATEWTRPFNDDLLNLLQTLCRLVRLEPTQDVLLREICKGPIMDVSQLRAAGVFPVPASARRPIRYSNSDAHLII